MKWQIPPRIKVLEALGCVADGRISFEEGESKGEENKGSREEGIIVARVYSSSMGKYYTVTYSPESNAIMANDNGSYWKEYLGYPSIALLMQKGVLPLDKKLAEALKGIPWKDINQKHKNDFSKTEEEVFLVAHRRGVDREELKSGAEKVLEAIEKLGIEMLGKKTKPPEGY